MARGGGATGKANPRPTHRRLDRRTQITLAILLALGLVAAGAYLLLSRSPPRTPIVTAAATHVLLNVSDISEVGWGEWGNGTNGTGAWRLFAVHNELILATLNVTLWVDTDVAAARQRTDAISANVTYATQDGGVAGADASLFWSYDFGHYAGMVVRRYNVVFLLAAHLESSFSLTKSDLAKWAGWQLAKIETYAS